MEWKGWGKGGYKTAKISNPGLDKEQLTFTGRMKADFNPHTGYTFITCDEISSMFPGKDAYLHASQCPWVNSMSLLFMDKVQFQIKDEGGSPQVTRLIKDEAEQTNRDHQSA